MGFFQSIVIGSCSFLLGLIFVCQTVDIPLLYASNTTQANLENAYTFYAIWYSAPAAVRAVLNTACLLPLLALVVKLHRWTESAMFFDGSSLGELGDQRVPQTSMVFYTRTKKTDSKSPLLGCYFCFGGFCLFFFFVYIPTLIRFLPKPCTSHPSFST